MTQRVTVIGGGVIGLSTAYALVREGFDVDLIEAREQLASGASFANGGQLSYRYVAPLADAGVPWQALGWMLRGDSPLRLRPRLDLAQWRWMLAFLVACRGSVNRTNAARLLRLALHSQQTLQQWREEDGLDGFAWRRNGKLVVFRDRHSFAVARDRADARHQQIVDGYELGTLEPALDPSVFIGGIFTASEEVGDCHAFCLTLAERLRASGRCRLHLGQPVTRLIPRGEKVEALQLGDRTMPVEHLVLCAGYRASQLGLPGLHLPVYPLKGYSLSMPAGPRAPQLSITDYDRKTVYARIDQQLRVAAMVDIVGFDETPDPLRLASLRRLAQAAFPDAGDHHQVREWAGMRPATPTGVPLLGDSGYRNLWLNLGHGALGFTLASGSAQLLVERIAGRTSALSV
ncbi:D-amino acid dehydrogenase [Pseudomonas japonica]|uniref:D-amino-acid dehydrogenase n=1 Tax=Pseudomonas japonica TaxID=256466 RepID=A0A239DN85_9PSED|nr:D-amino acid dehydrogenase [Pseudomonas japonica]SNS33827.1 D-amino-acid dehydrogenase [Pseudomonas japonica]